MEVECVYENGVLKPLKPVKLKEGERVSIEIRKSVFELVGSLKNVKKFEERYYEYIKCRARGKK